MAQWLWSWECDANQSRGQRKWSFQLLLRNKSSLNTKSTLPLKQVLSLLNSYLNTHIKTESMDIKGRRWQLLNLYRKTICRQSACSQQCSHKDSQRSKRKRNIHSPSHPMINKKGSICNKGVVVEGALSEDRLEGGRHKKNEKTTENLQSKNSTVSSIWHCLYSLSLWVHID